MLNLKDNQNQKKNTLTTLYPFNGRSPYLIDEFYIIGYNYLTLKNLLIKHTPKVIEEENKKEFKEPHWGFFNFEEEPSILNEINNDYNKEILDSSLLIKMIFPHQLKCYYTCEDNNTNNYITRRTVISRDFEIDREDDNDNTFKKLEFKSNLLDKSKSYNVVFSINPQMDKKNSKKSLNGIAHIFYRKFLEKKVFDKRKYIYYVPYVFCITSEFPFFNSFNKLIKGIKSMYEQESIYIPIEILIYNIITLSPSPLNSDIILDISGSCSQKEIFGDIKEGIMTLPNQRHSSQKNIQTNFEIEDRENIIKNFKKNSFQESFEDSLDSLSTRSTINIKKNRIKPPKKNTIKHKITINKKKDNPTIFKIKFKFLSGYPLIQYNLPKVLFNRFSTEKIITIFLYMFLEKDVLFFSQNIEYLTLSINAYLNLHFPLNDEKYYFIGCAISLKDFISGNSKLGLKNYASLIGINDAYTDDYRNNITINDHLAVDLDKGEIYVKEDLDERHKKINENNKKLVKLIENLCKDTIEDEKKLSINLHRSIKQLSRSLKFIFEKLFNPFTRSLPGDYLDFSDKIYSYNIEIQESFYRFIQYICLYFYENLKIKSDADELADNKNETKTKKFKSKNKDKNESEMIVIFEANNNKYNEEELNFLNELKSTMKYQSFVYTFLQSYNPIDLYKIPLTFTEEFLSIISRKKNETKGKVTNIKFFKLIDSLYLTRKFNDIREINFLTFNFSYFRNYKNKFDREIYDRDKKKFNHDETELVKFISNEERLLIYQSYELDENILLSYINLIKNFSLKEYVKMFSSTFFVEENKLNDIDITIIETIIENNCIKENILTKSDICCANILLLFTISLKSLRETMDCQGFLGILFQKFTVFRKYFAILLRMIYKLCQESINQKKYRNLTNTVLCYYPCINHIRSKGLVPNEDLMGMITQFNLINIKDFIYPERKEGEENKKKEDNHKKKEEFEKIKLYGEDLEEEDISTHNLYVYNNFCSERFYHEKEILEYVNRTNQMEITTNTNEKIFPQIRFYNGIHKIQSFFISQKEIHDSLIKEYENYIKTLDNSKLNSKIILDSCLNIFIYMRNTKEFEDMDYISSTLQSIFYIFMNQLFIIKSRREKLAMEKMNS